mgnify:CR=1 FL=1
MDIGVSVLRGTNWQSVVACFFKYKYMYENGVTFIPPLHGWNIADTA